MIVSNKTRNSILADKAVIAAGVYQRVKGLLGRSSLQEGEALIIEPCRSVHTFFMRFAIDVLFVNKEGTVIRTLKQIKPYRLSNIYLKAHFAVELPMGTIERTHTAEGDCIEIGS